MKLYMIQFDGDHDYVEARNFTEAIATWHRHMKDENGPDWGEEQPESVTMICGRPVLR